MQLGFGNGRLEEFYVHCKCLTPEQMREPEVSCALAVRLVLRLSRRYLARMLPAIVGDCYFGSKG